MCINDLIHYTNDVIKCGKINMKNIVDLKWIPSTEGKNTHEILNSPYYLSGNKLTFKKGN